MNCKNCNTHLNDTYKFCHECGAKVITKRLNLSHILQNASAQFFNYDNKVFKTFLHLISKPEAVMLDYINGVRKRYINVIQYFAISLTITGLQFFVLNTFFENPFEIDSSNLTSDPNIANPKTVEESFSFVSDMMSKYYSLFYIFSLPVSALLSWLTFKLKNKAYNFSEHLIINTYYAAQMLIILAVISVIAVCFGINYMTFNLLATPFYFIYFWFVLKRIYKLPVLESIAYILIYLVGYFVFYFALITITTLITTLLV